MSRTDPPLERDASLGHDPSAPTTGPGADTDLQYVESAEKRRQRLSTGVLIAVVGVVLLILLPSTTGLARFALSDAFDEVQLPTVALPGVVTVLVCALLLQMYQRRDAGGGGDIAALAARRQRLQLTRALGRAEAMLSGQGMQAMCLECPGLPAGAVKAERSGLAGLLRLITDLRRNAGLTVVVISHDFSGLEELCPRTLHLRDGVLVPASANAGGVS